jgi:hypothetical protein
MNAAKVRLRGRPLGSLRENLMEQLFFLPGKRAAMRRLFLEAQGVIMLPYEQIEIV